MKAASAAPYRRYPSVDGKDTPSQAAPPRAKPARGGDLSVR